MASDPTEGVVRALMVAMRIPHGDGSIGEAIDQCVRPAITAAIAAERAACEAICRQGIARACADAIAARGR